MSATVTLTRKRGDTKRFTFSLEEKVDNDYLPIDITNWSLFKFTVNSDRNPIDTSTQIFQSTGVVVDALLGKVAFTMDGTVPVGMYFFDIQATDNNTEITTLLEGVYKVTQDITKD